MRSSFLAAFAALALAPAALAQQPPMHGTHGMQGMSGMPGMQGKQGMQPAPAADRKFKAGDLVIANPWTRATPKGAPVAGGFMTITNTGATPDRLVGGSFPQAGRFEVHEMSVIDGTMRMREVEGGLVIPPGQTVELKPGSYHVMLMELRGPVVQGPPIRGTLRFEKAGEVAIDYDVARIGGMPAGMQGMGGMGGMSGMGGAMTPLDHMKMQHAPKP